MSGINERQLKRSKSVVPTDQAARDFATDPTHNVILEASAGTGKTSVLVERYLKLLRLGVDPSNVLAITFTRQAAAEMRARIVKRLRADAAESVAGLARWQSLRDRLGDVSVGTVDAFCLSLLREFPLEADLDPAFGMADDTEVPRLVDDAVERTLIIGAALAKDDLGVAMLLAQLGPWRAQATFTTLLGRRLVVPLTLHRFLADVPSGFTPHGICRTAAARFADRIDGVSAALDTFLETGPVGDPVYALVSRDLRRLPDLGDADPSSVRGVFERVRDYFLTQKGSARSTFGQTNHGAAVQRRFREAASSIALVVRDEWRAFERDINVIMVAAVQRLFGVAVSEYRKILDARGLLDFSDVLQRAIDLLCQMDEFARSRYRLESRYHHVLVDEFQDTSRAQWELVSLLVRSWAEGIGVVDDAPVPPSIFVVGDRKQSIYRFRDADVSVLQDAAGKIRGLRAEGDIRRSISQSFRSVSGLLAFINDLFGQISDSSAGRDAFRYGDDDRFPVDEVSASDGDPGGAQRPLGVVVGEDIETCAEIVAAEIARLVGGVTVSNTDRQDGHAIKAGDIAILFRARASHSEFERALSRRSISTYVYKGLGFFDAEEIKDVRALIRFLAHPTSELRAAALMRSRLAGVSDGALVILEGQLARFLTETSSVVAVDRLGRHDRSRLELLRSGCRNWLDEVDRVPPAELLDRVLLETAYARELHGAHAVQARENMKKIRGLVRRIQNRGYATMARVSDQIDRLAGDISTAAVEAFDAVNLMTVHAAKGLEFPVVFLVDLGRGTGSQGPAIRVVPDRGDGHPSVTVWPYRDATHSEERRRDIEETKRLLYVASTRARDRLYLSTVLHKGAVQVNRGSFIEVLPAGFLPVFERAASGGETVRWVGPCERVHEFRVTHLASRASSDQNGLPGSLVNAPKPLIHLEPVEFHSTVTRAAVTEASFVEPGIGAVGVFHDVADTMRDDDVLIGWVVHRLLDRSRKVTVDATVIERQALKLVGESGHFNLERTSQLACQAAKVYARLCAHPDVAALQTQSCLFEVPYSFHDRASNRGGWGTPGIERGTIDCLIRSPGGDVTVLEFKTGTQRVEHSEQLQCYIRAARAMFPEAEITGRLVYSEPP